MMYKEFQEILEQSILCDLDSLIRLNSNEDVFAVALLTDSEFTTVRIGLGTISFLKNYTLNYVYKSIEEFSGIVWNPEEWNIFSTDLPNSKLFKLNYELNHFYTSSENLKVHNIEMERVFIDAFKGINLVELLKKPIFKFIYDTDPLEEEYLPNKSSEFLNPSELHNLFLKRYTQLFDFYPTIKIETKKRKIP